MIFSVCRPQYFISHTTSQRSPVMWHWHSCEKVLRKFEHTWLLHEVMFIKPRLGSSFMDLMVRKRKGWSRSQRKLCCSVSLLPWGLRIVDIKLSEIIGTIWCVLVFSTKVNYIPISWCELGTHVTSPRQKWNSPPQGKPYMSNSPLPRDNQWSNT